MIGTAVLVGSVVGTAVFFWRASRASNVSRQYLQIEVDRVSAAIDRVIETINSSHDLAEQHEAMAVVEDLGTFLDEGHAELIASEPFPEHPSSAARPLPITKVVDVVDLDPWDFASEGSAIGWILPGDHAIEIMLDATINDLEAIRDFLDSSPWSSYDVIHRFHSRYRTGAKKVALSLGRFDLSSEHRPSKIVF